MSLRTQPQSVDCQYEWFCPWGWSERRPTLVDPLRLVWFVVKKEKPTRWGDPQSLPVAGWLSVDQILEGYSGKKEKTHCVMEPSCGWICNPTIVWLDEFAVVKILERLKKPTGCPRFDPAFGSNNNPLLGSLSIMIITEHSIFVGWRLLFQNPAVYTVPEPCSVWIGRIGELGVYITVLVQMSCLTLVFWCWCTTVVGLFGSWW